MIREYVEHKFNGTRQDRLPTPPHKKMWFVRGVIRVDGVEQAFAAWDYSKGEAEKYFQTFLDPRCICDMTNRDGKNPPCPIHAEAQG